jgi:hypothetical protein
MRRLSGAGKKNAGLPSKRGHREEGKTILFVDQSGFYLLPSVVRTYAR